MTDLMLHEVRCRTCSRVLGVARGNVYTIFCNPVCATDYPVEQEEDRNAYIEYIYRATGRQLPLTYFATAMGLSRQRIFDIVKKRRIQA